MSGNLDRARDRIDQLDADLLDILQERIALADEILATKIADGTPVFVADRERDKVRDFRERSRRKGLDPDHAEDLLRLVMELSRNRQSRSEFPRSTPEPKTILLIGGRGGMGSLYARYFLGSGHEVRIVDADDWSKASDLAEGVDAAVVTVPIRVTDEVIARVAPHLRSEAILADFTSHKAGPVAAMTAAHAGPVLGLHPMHGPDVESLARQLLIVCPGAEVDESRWLLDQFELWGLRTVQMSAAEHDRIMHQVQGLRHFVALLHGSFMRDQDLDPETILAISSPIYRAELMMTGRIFAQSAELYADIVFSSEERREVLMDFFKHHGNLVKLVEADDKDGFIREFEAIADYFGGFAERARKESGYLIHRLADRFVE